MYEGNTNIVMLFWNDNKILLYCYLVHLISMFYTFLSHQNRGVRLLELWATATLTLLATKRFHRRWVRLPGGRGVRIPSLVFLPRRVTRIHAGHHTGRYSRVGGDDPHILNHEWSYASANKRSVDCKTQLAWKCLSTPTFFVQRFRSWSRTDWPNFGVQSGFISESVHARLQVSACSGYDLCFPG